LSRSSRFLGDAIVLGGVAQGGVDDLGVVGPLVGTLSAQLVHRPAEGDGDQVAGVIVDRRAGDELCVEGVPGGVVVRLEVAVVEREVLGGQLAADAADDAGAQRVVVAGQQLVGAAAAQEGAHRTSPAARRASWMARAKPTRTRSPGSR